MSSVCLIPTCTLCPDFKDCLSLEHQKIHQRIHELESNDDTELSNDELLNILKFIDFVCVKIPEWLYPYMRKYLERLDTEFIEHTWVHHELKAFRLCFQRVDAIDCAVQKGRLDWIQFARKLGYSYSSWTYLYATKTGNMELINWIIEDRVSEDVNPHPKICEYAVKFGQLEVLKTFLPKIKLDELRLKDVLLYEYDNEDNLNSDHYNGAEMFRENLEIALKQSDYIELIEYVMQSGVYEDFVHNIRSGLCFTAGKGHLDMFKWWYKWLPNEEAHFVHKCIVLALEGGYFDIVQWLVYSCGERVYSSSFWAAVTHRNTDIILWVYNELRVQGDDFTTDEEIFDNIHRIPIHLLKWMHIMMPDVLPINNRDFIMEIVTFCKLETVKWFHEIGCSFDEGCIEAAIKSGRIKTVEYLKEIGCPDCENMCGIAARHAEFDMLVWLYSTRGYPLSKETVLHAVCMEEAREWLEVHVPADYRELFEAAVETLEDVGLAAAKGYEDIVEFFLEHKLPLLDDDSIMETIGDMLCLAAEHGHKKIVQNLLSKYPHAAEAKFDALVSAAVGGHQHLVEYLFDELEEEDRNEHQELLSAALHKAAALGHAGIVEFLINRGVAFTDIHNVFSKAIWSGHFDVAQLLLRLNSDRLHSPEADYIHAVDVLTKHGYYDIVQPLIDHKVSIDEAAAQLMLDCGVDINLAFSAATTLAQYSSRFIDFNTALNTVSHRNYPDIAKLLIEYGANVNYHDGTPFVDTEADHLYQDDDVTPLTASRGHEGTPLATAARWGNIEMIMFLLAHGANVRIDGDRALCVAVQYGHKEVVDILREHGLRPLRHYWR
jgi:ankyrin repeat protein